MPVPVAFRLALRQWLARPLRPILCSLSIAAAVALIVCVGAAFDSLRYSLRTSIGQMLGVADFHVRPVQKASGSRLAGLVLEQIRARGDVDMAAGRMESHIAVTKDAEVHWFDVVGVDPEWDQKLRPKIYEAGHGHELRGKPDEITIDSSVAEVLKANVGDMLSVSTDGKTEHAMRVVGIVKKPTIEMLSKPTVYLPLSVLAEDFHTEAQFNVIDVKLRDSIVVDDYDAYAARLGKDLGPAVQVSAGTHSKAKLAQETRSVQIILSLLATISAICAALIIGTTLSVGVQERVRQFGQLRCIGASRRQLVTFLLGDALVMLVIGEILGVVLGFAFSAVLVGYFPQFFIAYKITGMSLFIAVIDGCMATLIGAIIPIWQVMRVTPMAAVTVVAKTVRRRHVWMAAVVGLACLVLQQILWHGMPSRDARFYSYMILGAPLIFLGWALVGPAFLTVCEMAGAGLIGRLFAVRPALLRNAWSGTPWRAGAMIAALMIGVTLFTTVRAGGESLLASWVSPARLPDLLLYSKVDFIPLVTNLLPDTSKVQEEQLREKYPEIKDITTITSFSVKIKTVFANGGPVLGVDGPHFVGVNPESFARLVEMEYIQGDPATAIKELEAGHHIFVSKEFHDLRKLGVGDKITFIAANGKPVDFNIAAVVTSTGMELVKNYFDLRSVFQDHTVSAFLGSSADAHAYFRARAGTLMLVNIREGTSAASIVNLRQQLTRIGYDSVSSIELKSRVFNIVRNVVDALSVVALGALLVASLGVANMVIASVHARRYEFGVLRAIGSGRGQLIRLVLAEVTLIGIVAGILGAGAGLYFTCMAAAVDRLLVGFQTQYLAGHAAEIARNVAVHVVIAIGLTTVLAWLASIVPAARGAFSAQRTLLASGRG